VKREEPVPRAEVRWWLVEARVSPQVQANIDRLAGSEDVRHVAVLPDIHLGNLVNNGCAAATVDLVYPEAVGKDIGCGLSALGFQGPADTLRDDRNAQRLISQIQRLVPALKQSGAPALPAKLAQWTLSDPTLAREGHRDGAYQLGTLGCGNHFIEFQADDAGALWLMVHSGSRAMGQKIAQFHLARATSSATGLGYLDTRMPAGQAYLNDMAWAVEYARLNRLTILACLAELLQSAFGIAANEDSCLDSPHNFARRETHFGTEFIVHRKSANAAPLDEVGLIAGSMGSPSFLVRGLGLEAALGSSSHGAGRLMSRTEARQRIRPADFERQIGSVHCAPWHLNDLRDEAPAAYRDIRKVMHAQRDLVRQHARLTPVLNVKYPDRRQE
jgi:tRNA-splicing ligase RtcB